MCIYIIIYICYICLFIKKTNMYIVAATLRGNHPKQEHTSTLAGLPENLSPLHRTQATEARMVTGGFLELLQTPLQKLFMLLQCQPD